MHAIITLDIKEIRRKRVQFTRGRIVKKYSLARSYSEPLRVNEPLLAFLTKSHPCLLLSDIDKKAALFFTLLHYSPIPHTNQQSIFSNSLYS